MFSLIYFLLIGLVAGWIAARLGFGSGGLLRMMIIGVIGSFIGGYVVRALGFTKERGVVPEIITAVVGAIVLVVVLGWLV
ncbi:MAG: GlsB/YeaQ/YmgE family stress response membrane protein [Planctomycetota bacterium]